MNTNNILVADPFNEEHIKLFNDFEINNFNNKMPVTTYLTEIKKAYDNKSIYNELQNKSNELNIIVFEMNEKQIKDYCYIKGEKDRKVCELFFAHLNSPKTNRTFLQKVSNYVLDILGMELVNVSINQEDKTLYSQLKSNGYEDIGEVNGKTTFIKEKEEIYENSKVML